MANAVHNDSTFFSQHLRRPLNGSALGVLVLPHIASSQYQISPMSSVVKRILLLVLSLASLLCSQQSVTQAMLIPSENRDAPAASGGAWPKVLTSQQGFFVITLEPINNTNSNATIPMRATHRWKMRLTDSKGLPVSSARILLDGGMPAHAHGLPSAPKVKAVSNQGDYVVDGMKFNMGGEWILRFTIVHERKDRANLTIQLAH